MKLTSFLLKAGAVLMVSLATSAPFAQDTGSSEMSSDPAAVVRIPDSIEGTWRTLNGTEINIQPCGNRFCGTFSYIVIPAKDAAVCQGMAKEDFAQLILDYNNPNKSLQSRNLLGLRAVTAKKTGDPNEYTVNIYNAEEGKNYDVLFRIRGNVLTLGAGCLAGLCAVTQDWPRVPDRPDAPTFNCGGM